MQSWLDGKVLPGEVQSYLKGYEEIVSLQVAELISETEAYLS